MGCFFFFSRVYISVHLLPTIFILLNSESPLQTFSFIYAILFQGLLEKPQDLVPLWCCHIEWWRRGVTHLISAKPGWDIIQLKAKRDSIGKHHTMLFVYCTCLLGVMLKVAALFRKGKAGRCWR